MGNTEQYAKFFPNGTRVGVGIPMQNNELFRDWAIILSLDGDLASVQLSRDVLPADVDMQTGKVLELRVGVDGKGYRCSGVYVSDGADGTISLRLTGDVNSSELREFYRMETFLPFQLQISSEHNLDHVLKEWRDRRDRHLGDEMARREEMRLKRRDLMFRIAAGEFSEERDGNEVTVPQLPDEALDHIDAAWDTVVAGAVNLSAGGFKFITSDHFELEQIVFVEAFIPISPPRIMVSVARIVFKNRNYYVGTDKEYWNVALQFLFIDERDRDAIVQLISNLELMRIRMARQKSLPSDTAVKNNRFGRLKMAFAGLVLIALMVLIFYYLRVYSQSANKNEIGESFEQSIRKYLKIYN